MQCAACGNPDGKFVDGFARPVCDECVEKPRYRYYLTSRPPGIGCQPNGWISGETFMPMQNIPDTQRGCFGWVEYMNPLAPEQVYRYELWPADEAELEAYQTWRER